MVVGCTRLTEATEGKKVFLLGTKKLLSKLDSGLEADLASCQPPVGVISLAQVSNTG